MATIYRSRATVGVNAGSAPALVTHYWDSTGAAPAAMATEILARVRAQFAAMASVIGSSTSWSQNPVVDEIDEATGAIVNQQAGTLPAGIAFSGAGSYLPLQTQGVVGFNTNTFIGGRRLKGRQFIPGLTAGSSTAGGNVAAATITALGAGNTALGATVVTALNQRVWHRPVNGTGGLSVVVATRTVSATFGVLRSRRS